MSYEWPYQDSVNAMRLAKSLRLDFQGEEDSWEDEMTAWQERAIRAVLGLAGNPAKEKKLVEVCGPVGCAKDQIIGACILAILKYGPEGSRVLVYSVDRDKSRECRQVCEDFKWRDEAGCNPPAIGRQVEFQRNKAINRKRNSVVVFESTDGASASGVIYDWAILNEVQEWEGVAGKRVYDHVLARRGKRDGRLAVFSNAPYTPPGDWRRDRWEVARRKSSDWYYSEIHVRHCSWLKARAAEARRNLPPQVYRRLYEVRPVDGRQELVDEMAVARAEVPGMVLTPDMSRGGRRFLGVDLGINHDHTALCMVNATRDGEVFLEAIDVWIPPAGAEVPLDEVEERLIHYGQKYRAEVWADPYQAKQMLQHARSKNVKVEEVAGHGKSARQMCHAVINLFRENRVRMPPEAGKTSMGDGAWTSLRSQLLNAGVKHTTGGVRIDVGERSKAGHGDILMAFAYAALGAEQRGLSGAPAFESDEEAPRVRIRPRLSADGLRGKYGKAPVYLGTGKTAETWRRYA